MHPIRVALVQMIPSVRNLAENMARGEQHCRTAREMGADVVLFPEMWSLGYWVPEKDEQDVDEWLSKAIGPEHGTIVRYRELARELDLAIAVTYLENWLGAPRNTVSLIDRSGEIVLTYAKVHTCRFDAEIRLTPGDQFAVCALDTSKGEVQVGCMICYDREFPESARTLMLNGAELILVPNACEMATWRMGQLRVRAIENMVAVALANYPSPQNDGHSVAFDPVLYPPDVQSERDTLIVEAGDAEGIFIAVFDMDSIREYRGCQTWGDAYRRPSCYQELTRLESYPPFARDDAAR